ncbi:hypothetical protein IPF37_04670 [bacterium]|nr:MAG: hypothetical protein IPF37_04670 [bacterium]
MKNLSFKYCLALAASCFFGVAQGAATKNWDPLFEGLTQPNFRIDTNYQYTDWFGFSSTSNQSTKQELGTATKADLEAFFTQFLDKLIIAERNTSLFGNSDIRIDFTWQQVENFLKLLNDDETLRNIRGTLTEFPDQDPIVAQKGDIELSLESLKKTVQRKFDNQKKKDPAFDKTALVPSTFLKSIWADADTPAKWKPFFNAIKHNNFNIEDHAALFTNATKQELESFFGSFFRKLKTTNLIWQQVRNFNKVLKNQTIVNSLTNKTPSITIKKADKITFQTPTVLKEMSQIIDEQKSRLAVGDDNRHITKLLWQDILAKAFPLSGENKKKLARLLDAKEIELQEKETALKTASKKLAGADSDEQKRLQQEYTAKTIAYQKAQRKHEKATRALQAIQHQNLAQTDTPLEQLNNALVALKAKLAHLGQALHQLQDPSYSPPAPTTPPTSAKLDELKQKVAKAKEKMDKTKTAEVKAQAAYEKFFEQFQKELAQKGQLEHSIENLKAEINDLKARLTA